MKVGDYVRTEDGKIEKYSGTNDSEIENFALNEIVKSSPNIIDLIEVGDYVNGYKVDFTNIENKLTYEEKNIGFYDGDGDITLFENDIKSIVTKEMFSIIEYEVKK